MLISHRTSVVARLGTAQTLAWASSYYLPALLAAPLAAELGMAVTHVFGAFTLALVIGSAIGIARKPWCARLTPVAARSTGSDPPARAPNFSRSESSRPPITRRG